jgi:hypothetical protein
VSIVFEIPVGRKIRFGNSIESYNWFTVRNNRHNFEVNDDDDDWDDWNYMHRPQPGKQYIMNPDGKPEKITAE